jgi:hypothetical protein
MTATTKYFILTAFVLTMSQLAPCQTAAVHVSVPSPQETKGCKPPKNRELFHDYINKAQENLLKSDGKNDAHFTPSANEDINFLLTQALVARVDQFQCSIENDSSLSGQDKVRYLRGMDNLLKFFNTSTLSRKVNPVLLPDIITAYEQCMQADKNAVSIYPIINNLSYAVAYSVVKADRVTFEKNTGIKSCQDAVILKYCLLHPNQTFQILKENPDMPFADSMVRIVARRYPRQLYDYAQASNKLGVIIRNIQDDIFIRSVVRMARSKDGQQYFPFLDNIVKGKMSFEDIDSVKNDSIKYYRLLVKTQVDYVERAVNKDTAMESRALWAKLETRAREVFVNEINGLHELDDPIRFRIIQPLNAQELYYLAVSTDGLIYTSSFVRGVYPLMMKKINNRSDSLLRLVMFDKYRKFIKMAAGYNTLSNFLGSFPNQDDASNLMRAFVKNLEKSDGLEDGVDVADSYASIAESIRPLAKEMLSNVQENYQRNVSQNNKRGIAIYNILQKLFLSADTLNMIDLTKELGIPPVYEVPYKALVNDSGRVIMQVFFYGDKDGQGIFRSFTSIFSNANWKITTADKWICINSVKGRPVSIYANKALPEEGGEDEKAQKALGEYLTANKLYPTITIHRGHSYYAGATIDQMFGSSKIVFLGSCGGYHLVHDVLAKAPDAHIIASKQIGKYAVNVPFFKLLTDKVRNGNNIDWIPFWRELGSLITVEGFEDYIPPYKNLGALFIKAYKISMGEEENTEKAF